MKYSHWEVNPDAEVLSSWGIHKFKNVTLIVNKKNPFDISTNILYHNRNGQIFIVAGAGIDIPHICEFNILAKILKIPKETKFIKCILGIFCPIEDVSPGTWLKTMPGKNTKGEEIIVGEIICHSDPEYKQIKIIEKISRDFLYRGKISLPKPTLKKETPKIKSQQKIKVPIRRLK